MGLYLSKDIVEKMGHDIYLESTEGAENKPSFPPWKEYLQFK